MAQNRECQFVWVTVISVHFSLVLNTALWIYLRISQHGWHISTLFVIHYFSQGGGERFFFPILDSAHLGKIGEWKMRLGSS